MIGLPKKLNVDGKDYSIRTNYNIALLIFEAFEDPELNYKEKIIIMLECLYEEIPKNVDEAIQKAIWFLDGGKQYERYNKGKKIIDWVQDETIIFSALNKVAGFEIREREGIHWWTFLGYFNEIGEGVFTTIIHIRNKKNKGKKLEKYEQEFYNANKNLIDLEKRYSLEEQDEIYRLNTLLK